MSAARSGAALFCVSAALLAFELLLMRLLSLAWWGQFAGFVISVAMLGLAAAGLCLHFLRAEVAARPQRFFAFSATVFAALIPLSIALSQRLPFTPFLLTWSLQEYLLLALRVLLFALPFLFGGMAIGTFFVARSLPAGRLYACNMIGSALPALPLVAAMWYVDPARLLLPVALLALLAAAIGRAARLALLGALLAAVVGQLAGFRYSEYKGLPKTLLLPQAQVLAETYAPQGLVQQVESPHTRWLPGLSLAVTARLPPSQLMFTDADAMEVLFSPGPALRAPAFLRASPEALAYRLRSPDSVLLLRSGSTEALRALAHQAQAVVLVDDNPRRIELRQRAWAGASPMAAVTMVPDAARHFLAADSRRWDLVQLSLLGGQGAAAAGAASLDPDWMLTAEGFAAIWARLEPDGVALFSAWVENPPRAGLRLAAWAIAGLRAAGVADPGRHLLVLRSWSTLALLVSPTPFDQAALSEMRRFCDALSFDAVHHPGIEPTEPNRYNSIPGAPYYSGVEALLGPPPVGASYRAGAPYRLDLPTDQRPFFSHYFRWAALPGLIERLGGDWLPYVEWGYLLRVAALAVVAVIGLVTLVLPCVLIRSAPRPAGAALFLLLGLAYLGVEIWAMLLLSRYLSSAYLANALVLTVLLAASAAGSWILTRRPRPRRNLGLLLAVLGLTLASASALLDASFTLTSPARVALAAAWLAPLAVLMGFPFPYALARLRETELPWALALNGFGSVLGGLLAVLLAAQYGLPVLALCALLCYLAAAVLILRGA